MSRSHTKIGYGEQKDRRERRVLEKAEKKELRRELKREAQRENEVKPDAVDTAA